MLKINKILDYKQLVVYDITDFCLETMDNYFDEDINCIVFNQTVSVIETYIDFGNDDIRKTYIPIDIHFSLKRNHRIYLKYRGIIGFDPICPNPSLNNIYVYNEESCRLNSTSEEVIKLAEMQEIKKEKEMLKNHKIKNIEVCHDRMDIKLGEIEIQVQKKKVKLIKNNLIKMMTFKEFDKFLNSLFIGKTYNELKRTQQRLLNESSLITEINFILDEEMEDFFN